MRWWANAPDADAGWLSVKTTSGVRSSDAQATPFTTDAAPGTSVVRHAPIPRVTSACAIAAIAAAVSVAVNTKGNPSAPAAVAPREDADGEPPVPQAGGEGGGQGGFSRASEVEVPH